MMLVMTKIKRSLLDRWAKEVFGFFNDVGDDDDQDDYGDDDEDEEVGVRQVGKGGACLTDGVGTLHCHWDSSLRQNCTRKVEDDAIHTPIHGEVS